MPPIIHRGKHVPAQAALPHAIPFRIIFEEFRQRDPDRLRRALASVALPSAGITDRDRDDPEAWLEAALTASEAASAQLRVVENRGDATAAAEAVCHRADAPLKLALHALQGTAVCLSGGGIRSASFGLGILEGLAQFSEGRLAPSPAAATSPDPARGAMRQLDYLSTVSGGGYIGSWMMAWAQRTHYPGVIAALAGEAPLASADPSPQPLRNLRQFTSFLAPHLGLSLDTLALGAIIFRNLFANWLMLVPIFMAAFALPEVVRALIAVLSDASPAWHRAALELAFILFAGAGTVAAIRMPSWRARATRSGDTIIVEEPEPAPTDTLIYLGFVGPLVLGAILLVAVRGAAEAPLAFNRRDLGVLIAMAAAGFLAVIAGQVISSWRRPRHGHKLNAVAPVGFVLYGLFTAVITGLVMEHLSELAGNWMTDGRFALGGDLLVWLGVPLVIVVLILGSALLSALLGFVEDENDREWWARAGGILFGVCALWLVAGIIGLYGPALFQGGFTRLIAWLTAGLGSWVAAGAGASGATSPGTRPLKSAQQSAVTGFLAKYHLTLPLVAGAALFATAIGLAALDASLSETLQCNWLSSASEFQTALLVFAGTTVIALAANRAINMNIFSLHGMYRMRLMRAFLGASHVDRHPDPFTGFDNHDTPYECCLPVCAHAPLHVINATLNLTDVKNTAWQQRKAESFTFTPLYAGSWRVGYVPTNRYGGANGVTLATAMAISGAAFNPNMGYNSSPLVGLLMTLFNVRLGVWMPNPGPAHAAGWSRGGPTFSLFRLLADAFAGTNDTSAFVELTDGGHFENLALYEMAMRRCHTIVVSDAGADPEFQFEDLGNALRKIYLDLGIPIEFDAALPMKAGPKSSNRYCAVARIRYSCVDGGDPATQDGTLVYIKAALNRTESPDVVEYAKTHPEFPHESTVNQFYTESQFESYRRLGCHAVQSILATAPTPANTWPAFTTAAATYSRSPTHKSQIPGNSA